MEFLFPENQTRIFKAITEILHWFAGKQIRNVAVCIQSFLSKYVQLYILSEILFDGINSLSQLKFHCLVQHLYELCPRNRKAIIFQSFQENLWGNIEKLKKALFPISCWEVIVYFSVVLVSYKLCYLRIHRCLRAYLKFFSFIVTAVSLPRTPLTYISFHFPF